MPTTRFGIELSVLFGRLKFILLSLFDVSCYSSLHLQIINPTVYSGFPPHNVAIWQVTHGIGEKQQPSIFVKSRTLPPTNRQTFALSFYATTSSSFIAAATVWNFQKKCLPTNSPRCINCWPRQTEPPADHSTAFVPSPTQPKPSKNVPSNTRKNHKPFLLWNPSMKFRDPKDCHSSAMHWTWPKSPRIHLPISTACCVNTEIL